MLFRSEALAVDGVSRGLAGGEAAEDRIWRGVQHEVTDLAVGIRLDEVDVVTEAAEAVDLAGGGRVDHVDLTALQQVDSLGAVRNRAVLDAVEVGELVPVGVGTPVVRVLDGLEDLVDGPLVKNERAGADELAVDGRGDRKGT